MAAREAHLSIHLRQSRRHALLRLGRRGRRWPLCQDGAQRHRIWRHAIDLRDVPNHERFARNVERGDARRICQVERGRFGQLPDRNHPRYFGLSRRRGRIYARLYPRRGRPEGHRQVDSHRGPRRGCPPDANYGGGVCPQPFCDERGTRGGLRGTFWAEKDVRGRSRGLSQRPA